MKTNYPKSRMLTTFRLAVLLCLILFSSSGWAQIAAWQFGTPATIGDEEVAPATTYNSSIIQPIITRGNGIQSHNLARGFSSINWMLPGVTDNYVNAVSGDNYYEFIIQAEPHHKISISSIAARLRRSGNGPKYYQWTYSANNVNFIKLGSEKELADAVDEGQLITLTTTSIAAIQNLADTDTEPLIFRLYAWYALEETGTFAFGRTPEGTSTNSLEVNGTVVPVLTKTDASTVSVVDVRSTSANVYGRIADAGYPRASHHGFYWATHPDPTIADNKVDFGIAQNTDEFMYTLENLAPATKYYVKTYALNGNEPGYGQVLEFTTKQATAPSNIAISFTGSGNSTNVDNVLVENLTTGESKQIDGNAVLYLNPTGDNSTPTSIVDIQGDALSVTSVYPNPATASSTLSFGMAKAGTAIMSICDISGKIVSTYSDYLTAGNYKFQLPTLRSGVYFVTLAQNGKTKTQKLVSINNGIPDFTQLHQIEKTEHIAATDKPLKVSAATTAVEGMVFNEGNQLRFTATSGRCKTIIMDSPVKSKVLDIRFIECIDGDDNAYPVIKIGVLYWMAENLKTTRKTNGTALDKVTGAIWASLTASSDAYCYYADNDANAVKFGALYTHHAAKTELAPLGGWRLPTKKEFLQMAGYLDGRDRAGAKLKETGSENWNADNIYATNASGFKAKASGMKVGTTFSASGTTAAYWNSDETNSTDASFAKLTSQLDSVSLYADTLKAAGLSVRYVFEVPDERPQLMEIVFGEKPTEDVVEAKGLPLPANTVLMAPDKELFFTGRHDTSLSPQLRFMDNPAATSAPYIAGLPAIASGAVKWWENPKKVTTMVNGNGRESTVMAVWNEAEAGAISGYKNITLHIIGDESENYAQKTVVLPDKFWMPAIVSGATGAAYNGKSMNDYEVQECWQWEMMLRTGDVTGDGIPEILVAVHDTLRIYEYDGITIKRKYQHGFYSDFSQSKDFAFYLRAEVADMDQDGKNDVVVMTSTPKTYELTDSDVKCAKLHLFMKGNISVTDVAVYKNKALGYNFNNTNYYAGLANFAIGDINNDGVPEIALDYTDPNFYSNVVLNNSSFFTYILYDKNNYNNPFKFIDRRYVSNYFNWFVPQPIALAKLKGPSGPTYIIRGEQIFYIDASGLVQHNGYEEVPLGTSVVPYFDMTKESTKLNPVFGDQILVGNFDKDPSGREMLYYFVNVKTNAENPTSSTLKIYSSALNPTTSEVILNTNPVPFFNENSGNLLSKKHFPVMAAVNTRHTGRVLQFVRHEYTLTKPKLIVAMAAAPYYEGYYDTSYNPLTTWSKSSAVGGGKDTLGTHTATAIVGYEHEFELPILGTKIGGIEFTAKAAFGFSKKYSSSETTTITVGFSGGKENVAVVTSTPYDAFFYKILKSENPLEVNTEVMFGFPRKLLTQAIPVETYNKLIEGQNAPRVDKTVFRHTLGNPFSYPTSSGNPSDMRLSNLPVTQSAECASEFIGIGVRTISNATIGKENVYTTSIGFSQDYDFELVGTVGGFKAGAGYGYSKEKTESTSVGSGNQVEGNAPGLLSEANTYNWALKWYKFQKSGYKFQVVNYLVKR